jgi:hypothetical protein
MPAVGVVEIYLVIQLREGPVRALSLFVVPDQSVIAYALGVEP